MRKACIAFVAAIVPTQARASGDSSQPLTVPVVDAQGRLTVETRVFTYPHYYAGAVTAATYIFARPCSKTKPSPDDDPHHADLSQAPYDPRCNRINPLALSGITLSFGIASADEPPSHEACTLTVDLSKSVEPNDPRLVKAGLGSRKALVELAIKTLENTAGGPLLDCAIVYTGTRIADLPTIFRPVVSCGRAVARPTWKVTAAEQSLRDAVARNCTSVDPLLDLAGALSATARPDEALAVLARAEKRSAKRTFDRFATDPRFDGLRARQRGSAFVTSYSAERGDRCTDQVVVPATKIASVKIQRGECLLTTQKPVAQLAADQRWSTAPITFHDDKYRPDVLRSLRLRDSTTLVGVVPTLPVAEFCKPAFFAFESVAAESDAVDHCTISPVVSVTTSTP